MKRRHAAAARRARSSGGQRQIPTLVPDQSWFKMALECRLRPMPCKAGSQRFRVQIELATDGILLIPARLGYRSES